MALGNTFRTTSLISFSCMLALLVLGGCSTNPATGKSQFAALMPASQENSVGASEHEKVVAQFGLYDNPALQSYVNSVGQKVVNGTERPDVVYKFYVVDSPIVNAFALPGGYIYVSRGLLALSNSEAELAAVLAHEAAHITARHSAERYSHGVLTSLGSAVISAAVGSEGISQALGVGANLYLSSYSRGQESEADTLGIRYLSRAGYDTRAMAGFLSSMQAQSALESRVNGEKSGGASYFSTHPATAERVAAAMAGTKAYPPGGTVNDAQYIAMLDGMTYGDSEKQGFVRGQTFAHPGMGFAFTAPQGFRLANQADQVVATNGSGAAIVFDMSGAEGAPDALRYLSQVWMKGQPASNAERISIDGRDAATASFSGQLNGAPANIRIVAIKWSGNAYARFMMAIPQNASAGLVDDLKRTTYSFRSMTPQDRSLFRPYEIRVVKGQGGDTIAKIASRQPFGGNNTEYFTVMNGLVPGDAIVQGRGYKIVVER